MKYGMNNFPKRTRNHELETESKRVFENKIPTSWVLNYTSIDYGIDGAIEIVFNGEAKGEEFKIQLKSTDSEDEPQSVALEISTYNYYKEISKLSPILMILYHSKTKNLYVRWFHEFDPYYDKKGKKALRPENPKEISFYWNKNNLWSEKIIGKIEYDVALFKLIKTHQIQPPFKFFVKYTVDVIQNNLISSIFLRLNNRISSLNIINFEYQDEQNSIGVIEITDTQIFCYFKTNIASVVHLNTKKELSEVELTDLIIILLIVSLIRINYNNYAILLSSFIIDSKIAFLSSFKGMLIKLFVKNQSWNEYIKFLNNLNDYSNNLDSMEKCIEKALILASLMANGKYVDNNSATKILLDNIKNDIIDLGSAYYNLGNHYRSNGKTKEAFHYYKLAQKSNPYYRKRDYFWKELAGILFSVGRYKWSALLYAKAIKINNIPETLCLYADALMYSGKYFFAQKRFNKYTDLILNKKEKIDSEWLLKSIMLDFMLEVTNIKKQKRSPKTANKLITELLLNSKTPTKKDVNRLLELDLLCGYAWNAYSYTNQTKEGNNHIWALFCSGLLDFVIHELLCFIFMLKNNTGNKDNSALMLAWILDFISNNNGETELMETLTKIKKTQPASPNIDNMINNIYTTIQCIKQKQQKESFKFRFCAEDEVISVHEIDLN